MSSQDGTIEDVPEPTYESDDAIATAYSPAWADLFEHSSEDNDQRKFAVDAEARLDIMKSWIKACNKLHCDPPCVPSKADATTWPTWLIDVVDACIVEGSIADRYLTLSYVWGGVQTLQLSTGTIEQLGQYGSLSKHEAGLPKTIRQALEVTQLLDERYIFIDQLCIIQDDQQHKNTEIEHMAEIYANSFLTLVARAGETADSGLADDLDQLMRSNPNDHPPTYRSGRTTWERRGW
ncbi:uncharacterized protein J4E84_001582 [Alternaria hordeiaustralica]|uniref:uncharacterized protein n=1 Tax=Alternaria hordeiaustralica TaxID=1187925 RepID=UPI0020C44D37|nr:uncharacterized protein J4E84_001582 [Alternaria hordeiaustralica]KAI4694959.1 hypothetical protein J4E84_001582 [Alternaria hordeiaustralica]